MPIDPSRLCGPGDRCGGHGEPMYLTPSTGRYRCWVKMEAARARSAATDRGKAKLVERTANYRATSAGRAIRNEQDARRRDRQIIARLGGTSVNGLTRSDRLLLAKAQGRRDATASADNETILYLDVERMKAVVKAYVGRKPQWIRDADILAPEWIFAVGMAWGHTPDEFLFFRGGYEAEGRKRMLEAAATELREATTVVTYNGTNADIKWLQAEFAQYRIEAPTRDSYRHLDLFRVVGRELGLSRKSLRYAATMLLGQDKGEIDIEEAGEKALNGDENAWKEVRGYNQIDVKLLVELRELLVQQGYTY